MNYTVRILKSSRSDGENLWSVMIFNPGNVEKQTKNVVKTGKLARMPAGCSVTRLNMNFPYVNGTFSTLEDAEADFDKLTNPWVASW